MKNLTTIVLVLLYSTISYSQQVARKIVVEHFTNSNCSICASRNPGFYNTISQFSEIIHIAYHPSAPYASCLINQHNKVENDDRTNYYGVYGSTPRIVIQGQVIPASSNYGDMMLYQDEQNKTSSFSIRTEIKKTSTNTADVVVTIKKVDTSSLSSLTLYAVVAEDTLFYNAPNGENEHYDVFRKSVWGAPQPITAPANVGDSITMTQSITIHNDWNTSRTYVAALIQDGQKNVIQAERSATLDYPVSITMAEKSNEVNIYPNPANNYLYISKEVENITITSLEGRVIYHTKNATNKIDISNIVPGTYVLKMKSGDVQLNKRLVKH